MSDRILSELQQFERAKKSSDSDKFRLLKCNSGRMERPEYSQTDLLVFHFLILICQFMSLKVGNGPPPVMALPFMNHTHG